MLNLFFFQLKLNLLKQAAAQAVLKNNPSARRALQAHRNEKNSQKIANAHAAKAKLRRTAVAATFRAISERTLVY